MVITIKPMVTAEEIEGKSRVHWQTWREAYDEILPADFQEQMTLDKCRFYSQKYPENTLIALDDAKVVGFVSYGDFRDSATIAGEIFALYVLKDYYGKGVGRQLIQAAFAALDGYQEIILWVLEDNKRAIAFYEKMGFVSSKSEERSATVEQFREKELSILVTTTILERGVTFPQVDVFVCMANHHLYTSSSLIQIGGRVGRSPDRPTGKLYFFHEGLSKSMLRCREEIKVMNKKGGFENEVSTM